MPLPAGTDPHQTTMRGAGRFRVPGRTSGRLTAVAVAVLLLVSAAVHLDAIPTDTHAAGYLGVVLGVVGGTEIALAGAALTGAGWLLVATLGLAAADIASFMVTRTVGMPQAGELVGRWGRPGGLVAVGVDLALIAVTLPPVAGSRPRQPEPGRPEPRQPEPRQPEPRQPESGQPGALGVRNDSGTTK